MFSETNQCPYSSGSIMANVPKFDVGPCVQWLTGKLGVNVAQMIEDASATGSPAYEADKLIELCWQRNRRYAGDPADTRLMPGEKILTFGARVYEMLGGQDTANFVRVRVKYEPENYTHEYPPNPS